MKQIAIIGDRFMLPEIFRDKIAAACGRACLASLEERGFIQRKFDSAFRTDKPWKRDLLNRIID